MRWVLPILALSAGPSFGEQYCDVTVVPFGIVLLSESFVEVGLQNRTQYGITSYDVRFELVTDIKQLTQKRVTETLESPIGPDSIYKHRYMVADLLEDGQRMLGVAAHLDAARVLTNAAGPTVSLFDGCEDE